MTTLPALRVDGLSVTFGGVKAVDRLSLQVPPQAIIGLIGPNGAGKTTTFNACTGLVRPASGSVHLGGVDVTHMSVSRRGRLGLGRSFQRIELFGSMSVFDNVAFGREAAYAGRNPWKQVWATRQERVSREEAANAALEMCGIRDLATSSIRRLSTGQRRLVELARLVAGQFDVLLLDEPSSGLDARETMALGAVLEKLVAERRKSVLLVEHDMTLVWQVCEFVHVLDFGKPLFEGTPAEVQSSPIVRKAYLGEDAPEMRVDAP